MTEVWVVLDGYHYDGFGPPLGVFTSSEKAEALKDKIMNNKEKPDYCAIFRCALDIELQPDSQPT